MYAGQKETLKFIQDHEAIGFTLPSTSVSINIPPYGSDITIVNLYSSILCFLYCLTVCLLAFWYLCPNPERKAHLETIDEKIRENKELIAGLVTTAVTTIALEFCARVANCIVWTSTSHNNSLGIFLAVWLPQLYILLLATAVNICGHIIIAFCKKGFCGNNRGETATGENNGGNTATGENNGANTATGENNGGNTTTGENNGGNTATGENNGGNTATGENNGGNTATGENNGANTATGENNGGNTATGENNGGNTATGENNGANTATGENNGGNTATGENNGGNTATGENNGGNTATGENNGANTATGENTGGNTTTGENNGGNTATGENNGGNTATGENNGGNTTTGENNSCCSMCFNCTLRFPSKAHIILTLHLTAFGLLYCLFPAIILIFAYPTLLIAIFTFVLAYLFTTTIVFAIIIKIYNWFEPTVNKNTKKIGFFVLIIIPSWLTMLYIYCIVIVFLYSLIIGRGAVVNTGPLLIISLVPSAFVSLVAWIAKRMVLNGSQNICTRRNPETDRQTVSASS